MVFWTQLPLQGVPGHWFLKSRRLHQPLSHPLLVPGRARSSARGACGRSCSVAEHREAQFTRAKGYPMTSGGVCTRPCTGAAASSQLGAHGGLLAGLAVSTEFLASREWLGGSVSFWTDVVKRYVQLQLRQAFFNFCMSLLMFFKDFHLEKMLTFCKKLVLDSVSLILE